MRQDHQHCRQLEKFLAARQAMARAREVPRVVRMACAVGNGFPFGDPNADSSRSDNREPVDDGIVRGEGENMTGDKRIVILYPQLKSAANWVNKPDKRLTQKSA